MSTRRPRSHSDGTSAVRRSLVAALACIGMAVAAPAYADDSAQLEARLRAAYPMSTPTTTTFAGIDVARVTVPGLRLKTRDDRTPERGGITLSFADDHGQVRAVVRLA